MSHDREMSRIFLSVPSAPVLLDESVRKSSDSLMSFLSLGFFDRFVRVCFRPGPLRPFSGRRFCPGFSLSYRVSPRAGGASEGRASTIPRAENFLFLRRMKVFIFPAVPEYRFE